ncbi:MAG: YgfZ/GcvT domain-containing protein [Rhizobiaceae bacterium]
MRLLLAGSGIRYKAIQTQDVEALQFLMPTVTLDNRSEIAIDGEEAEHFLHNLVTTDITSLPAAELRPGALLTAQGKILFGFLIARSGAGFVVEVDNRDAADFAKRLKFFRLRAKVNIGDAQPVALQVVWNEPKPDGTFVRDARFVGVDVWRGLARQTIDHVASELSDTENAAWAVLRIEHGVAQPYSDFDYGDVFPHDINLDQTAGLSFSKGCYVGQEVVSRMHHRGTARWRLMVAKGVGLEQSAPIVAAGKPVGTLGTVAGQTGLALVRLDRAKDAIDQGLPIEANGKVITLSFPAGVTYDWPKAAEKLS